MPTRNICDRHAVAMAFFDDPNFLVIHPATTATSV